MKRSEAEILISILIKQCFKEVEKRPDIDDEIKEQYGEIILKELEKAGMLPPQRNADQKSSYGYAQIWEWEPEDEKI